MKDYKGLKEEIQQFLGNFVKLSTLEIVSESGSEITKRVNYQIGDLIALIDTILDFSVVETHLPEFVKNKDVKDIVISEKGVEGDPELQTAWRQRIFEYDTYLEFLFENLSNKIFSAFAKEKDVLLDQLTDVELMKELECILYKIEKDFSASNQKFEDEVRLC